MKNLLFSFCYFDKLKNASLPKNAFFNLDWIKEGHRANEEKTLEAPTGNTFRVIEVIGLDSNEYLVLEISDWVSVAGESLKAKGKKKLSDSTRDKLIDFLTWFVLPVLATA